MHLIDFVVRARKEFVRSKYDTEIRVSVDIDAEKEVKQTERELNVLAEKIRKKINELEKELSKRNKKMMDNTSVVQELNAWKADLKEIEKSLLDIKTSKATGSFDNLTYEALNYESSLKRLEQLGYGFGDKLYDQMYLQWKNAANAVDDYKKSIDAVTEKEQRLAKEKQEKLVQKELEKQEKLRAEEIKGIINEQRLLSIKESSSIADQKIVALANEKVLLEKKLAELKAAGVGLGYTEYDKISVRLSEINSEINKYALGLDKGTASAKKCFNVIKKGSKESTKGMNATTKALGNVVLSMIAFQALMKGTEFIAAGFKNLVQYSDELNTVFSDLKSQTATLKNSLATAFAPMVEQMVPYLTKLISWLNTAMDTLAQFWAFLSGKSTYTRAKKQVVDYAKSIEDASKSAKGALASFDEINVLNKDDGTSNTGGEVTGGAAFEEAEVDQSKFEWVNWLKDNLNTILEIVGAIGIGFLAWQVTGLIGGLMGITIPLTTLWGVALLVGGSFAYIFGICDALVNGLDWGNFTVIMLGAAAAIGGAALLFGPAAAGVVALCAGIGMLVVGLKDAFDNGINLKNGLMIVAGVFLSLVGIFGFGVAAIAALITGLVLCIIRDWENFKQTVIDPIFVWIDTLIENFEQMVNGIKNIFDGIIKFIKGVFTLDWKLAWEGICQLFIGVWDTISGAVKLAINGIIGFINLLINAVVGTVNAIVSAINSLNFTAPDWVPFIGGESISFNLPTVTAPNIPYLATGGTVTADTLARISEGGRKEVVLPLEQNTEWADILSEKIGTGRPIVIRFEGDLAELGRILKPVIDSENGRVGTSLVLA